MKSPTGPASAMAVFWKKLEIFSLSRSQAISLVAIMSSHYSNPIIPGFAPDPSLFFVDGLFWEISSTRKCFEPVPSGMLVFSGGTHYGRALGYIPLGFGHDVAEG